MVRICANLSCVSVVLHSLPSFRRPAGMPLLFGVPFLHRQYPFPSTKLFASVPQESDVPATIFYERRQYPSTTTGWLVKPYIWWLVCIINTWPNLIFSRFVICPRSMTTRKHKEPMLTECPEYLLALADPHVRLLHKPVDIRPDYSV